VNTHATVVDPQSHHRTRLSDPMLMLHLRRLTRTIRETAESDRSAMAAHHRHELQHGRPSINRKSIGRCSGFPPGLHQRRSLPPAQHTLLGEDHDSAIEASLILDPQGGRAQGHPQPTPLHRTAGTHTVDPLPEGRGGDPPAHTAHTIYDLAEHFLSTDSTNASAS